MVLIGLPLCIISSLSGDTRETVRANKDTKGELTGIFCNSAAPAEYLGQMIRKGGRVRGIRRAFYTMSVRQGILLRSLGRNSPEWCWFGTKTVRNSSINLYPPVLGTVVAVEFVSTSPFGYGLEHSSFAPYYIEGTSAHPLEVVPWFELKKMHENKK